MGIPFVSTISERIQPGSRVTPHQQRRESRLNVESEQRVDSTQFGDELTAIAASLRDPRAFAPLYEKYFPLVHSYCLRRLSTPENAADATSQIFINAIQSLPKFKPDPSRSGSSFRSWLFTIARNVVIDSYRRTRPHLSLDKPVANGDETIFAHLVADSDPMPEELAIASETRSHLGSMLTKLPERRAAIVELRLAGLTNAEIAKVLNISYPAVRSAQYRAILTLRELLTPEPQTHPENVQ